MIERTKSRIKEGSPYPRGATWDGKGTNFAIFSANATKIELCIFDGNGQRELERVELPEYTDQIWHGYLPEVHPGTPYGYRVHVLLPLNHLNCNGAATIATRTAPFHSPH